MKFLVLVALVLRLTEGKLWFYLGCFDNRGLPTVQFESANLTVDECLDNCTANGYKYAGLQNYSQCRCGNYEYNMLSEDDKCTYSCHGNVSQICGGYDYNSVYMIAELRQVYLGCFILGGLPTVQFESANLTVDDCIENCMADGYRYASLHSEDKNECRCGNKLDRRYQQGWGNCTTLCPGNSSQICGGNDRNSVYAIVRYTARYQGCYEDRFLDVLTEAFTSLADSVDNCVDHCQYHGYRYAGIQDSKQCRCGNSEYTTPSEDDKCSLTCLGDDSQICGGQWYNSVYLIEYPNSLPATTSPPPTTIFSTRQESSSWGMTTQKQTSTTSYPFANRSDQNNGADKDNSMYVYIGVGVAVFVIIICALVAGLLVWRRKKQASADLEVNPSSMPLQPVD